MSKKVVMSGMRPTGPLHLGHWEGALKNWLELQETYQCYFAIADWHALTTEYQNPTAVPEHAREILLDWLSIGLDPQQSVIYQQSEIKETAELFLLFSMFTPLGWLERVPTFKDQQQQLKDRDLNTFGFLGYPLLQAVDISIMRAHIVPVGEDQVYHIELGREIVRRFNAFYGDVFPEPMQFLTPIPRLLGTDGRKMSKSYNNAILLSDPPEVVDRKIRPMMTDVRRQKRTDPGIPTDCPVFPMHNAFSSAAQVAEIDQGCRSAGIGCIECKKIVIAGINAFLAPLRERRREFEKEDLTSILAAGNQKARAAAQATMVEVRRQIWQ